MQYKAGDRVIRTHHTGSQLEWSRGAIATIIKPYGPSGFAYSVDVDGSTADSVLWHRDYFELHHDPVEKAKALLVKEGYEVKKLKGEWSPRLVYTKDCSPLYVHSNKIAGAFSMSFKDVDRLADYVKQAREYSSTDRYGDPEQDVDTIANIRFAQSRVQRFYRERTTMLGQISAVTKPLRLGQHFYEYFELYKVTNKLDKNLCDMIYNADNHKAALLIARHIDGSS